MKRINVNGTIAVSILGILYLAGALVVMAMAAPDPTSFDVEQTDSLFWTGIWAAQGCLVWLLIVWFLNEQLTPPAHSLYLPFMVLLILVGLYLFFNWTMETGIFAAP